MATNLVNARLVPRFRSDRLLVAGNAAAALAGVVLGIDGWTGGGGLAGLALPLFLFVSATGFIVANAISGALAACSARGCYGHRAQATAAGPTH